MLKAGFMSRQLEEVFVPEPSFTQPIDGLAISYLNLTSSSYLTEVV
jgi:hypothetical protein